MKAVGMVVYSVRDPSRHGLPPIDVQTLRDELPRPLVFTDGIFDLLHPGHVDCLERARRLGSSLVVAIHGNASARRLRNGSGRLINAAMDRAAVVGALAVVSAVILFDDDTPVALLQALRPDVYVRGGDDRSQLLPETSLLATWGGSTVIVPRQQPYSSAALVAKARQRPPALGSPPRRASAWPPSLG